jgi:hypothetical protein
MGVSGAIGNFEFRRMVFSQVVGSLCHAELLLGSQGQRDETGEP